MAVPDRPIGLQDDALDIGVGGSGSLAAFRLRRVRGGRARDDQRGGEQGCELDGLMDQAAYEAFVKSLG